MTRNHEVFRVLSFRVFRVFRCEKLSVTPLSVGVGVIGPI